VLSKDPALEVKALILASRKTMAVLISMADGTVAKVKYATPETRTLVESKVVTEPTLQATPG
jgi:hypothetical protein